MRCNGKWIYLENHAIKNITMRIRIDNSDVKNINKKLDIEYEIDPYFENGYDIDIIIYKINKETLLKLNKVIGNPITTDMT